MYPNGQGIWVRPGWSRRCAWALPSRLALCAVARASPSRFALLAHSLGFALTTIKWIHLLQLNEFIYFALQNLWIHLQNLWIHMLNNSLVNEFIYSKRKRRKNLAWDLNYVQTVLTHLHTYTLCHTTINLLNVHVFYNIYTNFIYDSHEW